MADIAIKDTDWNQLSSDEQNQIQNLFPNDNIVPSSGGTAALSAPPAASPASGGMGDAACEVTCLAVYDKAKASCSRMKGFAKLVCYGVCYGAYVACCELCKGRSTSNMNSSGGDPAQPTVDDNTNPPGGDPTPPSVDDPTQSTVDDNTNPPGGDTGGEA